MVALEIVEYGASVIQMLGAPLALGNQHPIERLARAGFQSARQKHLRMAQKSHIASAQAQLLPDEAHQPVRLRAAAAISVAACDQQQADVLRGDLAAGERPRHDIGETFDQ